MGGLPLTGEEGCFGQRCQTLSHLLGQVACSRAGRLTLSGTLAKVTQAAQAQATE